jgi:hypothetical protein
MDGFNFFFPTYDEYELKKMILGVFIFYFWVCNSQAKKHNITYLLLI